MNPDGSTIALFAFFSTITLIIGWKKGFFSLRQEQKRHFEPNFLHVAVSFFLYFGVTIGITPPIGWLLKKYILTVPSPPYYLELASILNFFNSGLIFLSLLLFLFLLPKALRLSIWKGERKVSFAEDIKLGLFAWVISFPVVVFINQASDWILINFLGVIQLPEQLAVHFLKMTFGHPNSLFLTVFTISIFAPLVEETLFRGFLQSFIRKHLGSKQAVFITSLLFALFHYSPEQKLANLTIIGSLFAFSLFLGILYEKRGSLFAPIFLHATFNSINVLNLYFLGGIPGGPF